MTIAITWNDCKWLESKRSGVIFREKLSLRKREKIGDDVRVYTINYLRRTYYILRIHSIAFPIFWQKE